MSKGKRYDIKYRVTLAVIIMLQFLAAFYFCTRKAGYHYDEYYSYYSSNVSYGLVPTDNAWMDTAEIESEFVVREGEGFNYGMVKLMQTYDVHPPFYYYILHTVCSLSPGVFSKWQGLSVNLVFWLLTFPVLIGICDEILCKQYKDCRIRILGEEDDDKNQRLCRLITIFIVFLYGFSPAILSGVMFIRMYVLLTFLCLLTVLINLKLMRHIDRIGSISYGIGLFALAFTGSQTHYYYIVFLFFTVAYMTIYILTGHGTGRADIKGALRYAVMVVAGLIVSVVYYPSMLRHIFRGYRGTEATAAFLDIGNIRERAGLFVGLLNDYLIYDFFYLMVFVILLFYVYQGYRRRGGIGRGKGTPFDHRIGLTVSVTAGYFLVVLKTALLNAEEAVRYEMPVYGLIILLLSLGIGVNLKGISGSKDRQGGRISAEYLILLIIMVSACIVQVSGLTKGRVLFLYEDDVYSYEWAVQHSDSDVVYIYNPDNQWMIWDDAAELMEYDRIFFISAGNKEPIADDALLDAADIYVYAVRSDEAMERIEELAGSNGRTIAIAKVRELQYADVYEIR